MLGCDWRWNTPTRSTARKQPKSSRLYARTCATNGVFISRRDGAPTHACRAEYNRDASECSGGSATAEPQCAADLTIGALHPSALSA
jgi:hypothetical protein